MATSKHYITKKNSYGVLPLAILSGLITAHPDFLFIYICSTFFLFYILPHILPKRELLIEDKQAIMWRRRWLKFIINEKPIKEVSKFIYLHEARSFLYYAPIIQICIGPDKKANNRTVLQNIEMLPLQKYFSHKKAQRISAKTSIPYDDTFNIKEYFSYTLLLSLIILMIIGVLAFVGF